jgi:phenylalanyl-tRNA synthetase beta subunit
MVEEVGRVYGYGKIFPEIPKIDFKPKVNEIFSKIFLAREKLLSDGYSEVMTYTFRDKGEVEVLASASDKKFLRINLTDGLNESLELNKLNMPLLGMKEIRIFEIGTVFLKNSEEIHIAWNEKSGIKEMTLDQFFHENPSLEKHENFLLKISSVRRRRDSQGFSQEDSHSKTYVGGAFKAWSIFPFIVRDIAVWVPEQVESNQVYKVIKENTGDLLVKGPTLFDEFKKEGRTSYAFRMIFQSYDRTLTDEEVNKIMAQIGEKITEHKDWQIR